ncbi:hypothetical protein [Streptomyces atratus]|uniref:hypothetical protein n=1 Tax=Streptomyces atratus TaxID=1893 RepID=UPI0034015C19
MDEDDWLRRHGLHPCARSLDSVRTLLINQTQLEREAQGDGDTLLRLRRLER